MMMNLFRHVGGLNGTFVAETPFGMVERRTEYPHFVYNHPDGRTARHLVGEPAVVETGPNAGADVGVDESGVHFWTPARGIVKTIPWEAV